MNRIHLFELEDFSWFPDVIRRGMLDYLSFFLEALGYYRPSIPLIHECLEHSDHTQILDLCSGGGGPVAQIVQPLEEYSATPVTVLLSDKFPNLDAFERLHKAFEGRISYVAEPVDAMNVPRHLEGVRTMFSAFHHFRPEAAKAILKDAAEKGIPIAIFDGGDKNLLTLLGLILVHPILFFFCTPFFRPFRWDRLLFTYLIPLIPLCTIWDGIVSVLRFYEPEDMLRLTEEIEVESYTWKAGKKKLPTGINMAFLIGYPKNA